MVSMLDTINGMNIHSQLHVILPSSFSTTRATVRSDIKLTPPLERLL